MSSRDRLVAALVALLVIAVFGWIELVSPERSKIAGAEAKVRSANQQLESARSALSQARDAQKRYSEAYAAIVALGKAVPASYEVPALVYEIEHAADGEHVKLVSLTSGGSSATATAGAKSAGFTQLPLTFTFSGSFTDLYRLLRNLQALDSYSSAAGVSVSGRLLTIQSLTLAPGAQSASGAESTTAGAKKSAGSGEEMTGTITATAYVLPVGESLTAGATASAPSGSAGSPAGAGSGATATAAGQPATIKGLP
jgi:Tfp pilus assembly protein PilO